MQTRVFEKLFSEGMISSESLHRVKDAESRRLISVHWELNIILYLGVLLLSGGLGIIIYQNIDTIGHQAMLALIAVLCAGSYYYAWLHRKPFSWQKVPSRGPFAEYAVLLGCLLAAIFISYLQAQYDVFGDRYGLAFLFPMILYFFSAYYFDHLGALCLGIIAFGGWLGISIAPFHILRDNDYTSFRMIFSGFLVGITLMTAAYISDRYERKQHFAFTYNNFGLHSCFLSHIAAIHQLGDFGVAWLIPMAIFCGIIYLMARRERSFYFMLIMVLYAYAGLSYVFLLLTSRISEGGMLYALYFAVTAFIIARLLIYFNKSMRT